MAGSVGLWDHFCDLVSGLNGEVNLKVERLSIKIKEVYAMISLKI